MCCRCALFCGCRCLLCGRYACGSDHDAGEAAHWPPWQATAVNYTRTLPDFVAGNLTQDTEEFMAFIFGVSIHYIADEMWEGLNDQLWNGQGFVRVMAAANLNSTGTNDNDEGPANMAGDFHMSYATDQDWLHPWKREYPLEKILEVYHLYGKPNVTLKSLQTCKLIFDLGLWAEQVLVKGVSGGGGDGGGSRHCCCRCRCRSCKWAIDARGQGSWA